MAISPELLDILVCPLDKAKVELLPDESGLKCVQCGRVYPIREDIPVMLIEENAAEEAAEAAEAAEEDEPKGA